MRHAHHICMNNVEYLVHAQTVYTRLFFLRLRKKAWGRGYAIALIVMVALKLLASKQKRQNTVTWLFNFLFWAGSMISFVLHSLGKFCNFVVLFLHRAQLVSQWNVQQSKQYYTYYYIKHHTSYDVCVINHVAKVNWQMSAMLNSDIIIILE